jgi:lysozyme family protein
LANFDEANVSTLQHEGHYTDHKDDRGGETYCGISRRWHPTDRVWAHIDGHKHHPGFRCDPNNVINHDMLASMVTDFYKREFWNKIKGDDIPSQKIFMTSQ